MNGFVHIKRSGRWIAAVAVLLVAALGLLRFDLVSRVDYVISTASYVVHKPGFDWNHRIVIVNLDDRDRVLQTSDHSIKVQPGQPACVRRTQYLLRQWTRYSLAMAPFCATPVATSLAAEAPGA